AYTTLFLPLRRAVLSLNDAHRTGLTAHNNRLGLNTVGEIPGATQQVAVGNTGCSKVAILRSDQIMSTQNSVQIMPGVNGLLALFVIYRGQTALDHPAGRFDSTRGDNALWGATGTQQHIDVGIMTSRSDATGHIAVHNEFYACAGFTNLTDQAFMSRTIENTHVKLRDLFVQGLR